MHVQVAGSFCRKAKLDRPSRVEDCGEEECPMWWAGPWGECQGAACGTHGQGV